MATSPEKIIIVFARCRNSKAKGDYAFACDLAHTIAEEAYDALGATVILSTVRESLHHFYELYRCPLADASGYIRVEGMRIRLQALEDFDPAAIDLRAFIDANRCRYPDSGLVKRLLSPDSRYIFVGHAHQPVIKDDLFPIYMSRVKYQQPGLFTLLSIPSCITVGLGSERAGIPKLAEPKSRDELSPAVACSIPASGSYGMAYLGAPSLEDVVTLARYQQLTGANRIEVIGSFDEMPLFQSTLTTAMRAKGIRISFNGRAADVDTTFDFKRSIQRETMSTMTREACQIVLNTGVASTLEALGSGKIIFYQYLEHNVDFVESYLRAIDAKGRLIATPDIRSAIKRMAALLFAPKPLSEANFATLKTLTSQGSLRTRLGQMNREIIKEAVDKDLSRQLLHSLSSRPVTEAFKRAQLRQVCISLQKPRDHGELPRLEVALRRACTDLSCSAEIKILLARATLAQINSVSPHNGRTSLHWAAIHNNLAAIRLLLAKDADKSKVDGEGRLAEDYASSLGLKLLNPVRYACQYVKTSRETTLPKPEVALRRAAASNLIEPLNILLATLCAEQLNAASPSNGKTALHYAVDKVHPAMVARLLETADISINKQDGSGKTALHYAALHANIEMIQWLLDKGASLTITDATGKMALDYIEDDQPELAALLTPAAAAAVSSIIAEDGSRGASIFEPGM